MLFMEILTKKIPETTENIRVINIRTIADK